MSFVPRWEWEQFTAVLHKPTNMLFVLGAQTVEEFCKEMGFSRDEVLGEVLCAPFEDHSECVAWAHLKTLV